MVTFDPLGPESPSDGNPSGPSVLPAAVTEAARVDGPAGHRKPGAVGAVRRWWGDHFTSSNLRAFGSLTTQPERQNM